MAQISIIEYNDIKKVKRIDAEYFKPQYLFIEKKLKTKKHLHFEDFSFITDGIHSSIDFDDNSNILLFSAKAPKENTFEISGLKNISQKQHLKNPRTALKENDVIISTVGTIGNCAVITKDLLPANSDRHVGIIRPKGISSFLISTFLLSKYGRMQSSRNVVGNVQPNLYIRDMKKFIIPVFSKKFEQDIEKIVKEAHKKQTQSKQFYKDAEQILLKELSLLNYTPKKALTFETSSNEVEKATRFDAEYFQPKYAEIIKHIENYKNGYAYVKDLISWKKGIEVGSEAYTEKGNEFVRVSDFSIFGIEETSRKISDDLYLELKENYQPKEGDILFTKDGTIGITSVLKNDIDGVLSSAFLTLTLKEKYKDFEKECLALILNSIVSKMQVEQLSGGAIIAHLKPSDFESFKIPLIRKEIQREITVKIEESFKLRKESKELLELAKRKVEEEIEKE